MMKIHSLKILLVLLGWLTVQSTVLSHEFSEEHLSSSTNHICLTQAVQLDDVVPTKDNPLISVIEFEYEAPGNTQVNDRSNHTYSSHLSRAPPLNS